MNERRRVQEAVSGLVIATIRWANEAAASARKLAVKLAAQNDICRICHQPPGVPTRLAYGEEYACEECLKGREAV